MRKIWFFFVFLVFATPANASNCYTATEAEAEQGIRIQSELMVIGLNCQHKVRGIYNQYRQMADKNSKLFEAYNNIMINYFEKIGVGNTEKEINSLRTTYANKISEIAAQLRPDVFCTKYAPRIEHVRDMSQRDLRKWATTYFPNHPLSKPICES